MRKSRLSKGSASFVAVTLVLVAGSMACRNTTSSGDRSSSSASSNFACTLILGVSASGEWVDQGGLFNLLDGARFEARTKSHEFVERWAGDTEVWTQPLNPAGAAPQPGGTAHACAQHSDAPDRVVFIGYTEPKNVAYRSQAAWEAALEQAVGAIQAHHPSVKRIELLTMVRGPLMQNGVVYPGGFNCDPALEEDIVAPYVDLAIAAEAAKHPGTVVSGPKFYVGDCSWWTESGAGRTGRGPHFVPNGMPALEAQKIADYYKSGTCTSPWCVP